MKALDTNVLVRFLLADHPAMTAKAVRLLEEAQNRGESFWVPVPVLLEVLWVLKAVYKYSRDDILDAMERLMGLPVLDFDTACPLRELVALGRTTDFGLADLVIGLYARGAGCKTTLTLDKKAAHSALFQEVD